MYSGDSNRSAVLYDSLRADSVPFEGVISDDSSIRIDFLAEEPAASTAFNIRFEGDALLWAGGLQEGGRPQRSSCCCPCGAVSMHGELNLPIAAEASGCAFPKQEKGKEQA